MKHYLSDSINDALHKYLDWTSHFVIILISWTLPNSTLPLDQSLFHLKDVNDQIWPRTNLHEFRTSSFWTTYFLCEDQSFRSNSRKVSGYLLNASSTSSTINYLENLSSLPSRSDGKVINMQTDPLYLVWKTKYKWETKFQWPRLNIIF